MRPRPCTCVLGPAHALGRRALAADARPRRCQPAHRQPAHRLCARAAPRWRSSRPVGRQTTECRARDNRHRGSPFDACHEGVGVGRVRAASGWAVRKWQWWQWGGGRRQTPSGSRGHHPQRSGAAGGNAWGEGRARLRGVLVSWARRGRPEECICSRVPPSCSVSASVVGPVRKPADHGRRARSASFCVRLRASGRGQARRKGIEPIPFTIQ